MDQLSRSPRMGLSGTLGVLASFWLSTIPFILTPAINSLGEYYADIPYSQVLMLSTLVPLMVVPFSMISGAVVGTKVGYRPMLLFSTALAVVGGMLPWFFSEHFYLVMASRVAVGIGVGLSYPLCNALVIRSYDGAAQVRMMGVSMVAMNVSGMLYQSVSGMVCARDIRYVWLTHGLIAIPLVLMFLFLKEPGKEAPVETGDAAPAEKSFFSMRIVVISLACCLLYALVNTVVVNMSTVLALRNLGDSATAGMVASAYAAGGLAAGFLYNQVYRRLKRWMVPFSLALLVIGTACCCFGSSIPMMIASEVCIGFATYLLWPGCCNDFAKMASPDRQALANGVISALWNLGVFLSAPYIAVVRRITGDSTPISALYIALWLMIGLSVVWSIARLKRPAKYELM